MSDKIGKIYAYFSHRWWLLLAAAVTGTFTWHSAGVFWGNIFYQVMAVTFTEGALLLWVYRLEGGIFGGADGKIDDNEWAQAVISGVSATVAFSAIVATNLAAAAMLASATGVFDIYASVPVWAQWIVTNMVWILAAYNVLMGGLYHALSPDAVLERIQTQAQRRVKKAEINAEREQRIAEAKAYEDAAVNLARDTGRAHGEANARKRFALPVPPEENAPRQYQQSAGNFTLPPKQ